MPKQTLRAAVVLAGAAASIAGAQSYPTERISIDGFDIQADMLSRELEPSADGRFVAFVTRATNFSDEDPDARFDVFLRDRFNRTLELVSIGTSGEISDGDSRFPSISADARFVAFETTASTFFPLDLNAQRDVYLRDRHEGTTTLVSRGMSGNAGAGSSGVPSVSNDGRWIAFVSDAPDLVPGDANNEQDVFLYDGLFGTIRRVSVSETGAETGGGVVGQPAMSADGKIIAFASRASDIIAGDPASFVDVYVYDRCSGSVQLVSRTPEGDFPSGDSFSPSISASGRYIAFSSQAEDLTEDSGNGFEDIFVHDRESGETLLVSVSTTGQPAAGDSFSPSIDAEGDTVIFASAAANLAPDDVDGAVIDLYARDLHTMATTRQSLTWLDEESTRPIVAWRLSDDGNWAGFSSEDPELAPTDTNGVRDDYLRWVGDPCLEREPNDRFIDRTWINLDQAGCRAISGKLDTNPAEGPAPDTFLIAYDKLGSVIDTDDNSSSLGNGKASALWLEPILDESDGTTTIRLAVTGRPDGVDNRPNGLFFNDPHGQLGAFALTVRYVDEDGLPVLDECEYVIVDAATRDADGNPLAFVTGAELFRLNFFPPEGAAMAHVEIDNTVGRVQLASDVDHFAFAGLPPFCDVAVTVLGCLGESGAPEPLRLGWFNKEGELVEDVVPAHAGIGTLQLTALTDANGRINVALTGVQDEDFDGFRDPVFPRDVGTPGYDGPFGHGAECCYTILVEPFEHDPSGGPGMTTEDMLREGDLNLDGVVNVTDLIIMLGSWGVALP